MALPNNHTSVLVCNNLFFAGRLIGGCASYLASRRA
jgi:hypothetical protein